MTDFEMQTNFMKRKGFKKIKESVFHLLALAATLVGIVSLALLIIYVIADGISWLDWDFITSAPSRFPEQAGIYPMLIGSAMVIGLVGIFTLIAGVGAAIYLEEYAGNTRLKKIIELNIANLAGVPSIVYGLLGLAAFVTFFRLPPGVVLVGALTLSLKILPIVIISAQESLKSVPSSRRSAAYGMGATKWQVLRTVVLPEALPGIMTGVILALANAMGETAPLIMIGAASTIFAAPRGLFSPFSTLPLQIFSWSDLPQKGFTHGVTPAAIIILIILLLILNGSAVYIRHKFKKRI